MSEDSSTKPLVAFDLDGTIVDSRSAVEMAYRDVGIKMPPHAWGRPWTEWLDDADAHYRKNVRYLELIKEGHVEVIPEVYELIMRYVPHPVIITGASEAAATLVLETVLPGVPFTIGGTGMSIADKIGYLLAHRDYIGAYVDDDLDAVSRISSACWTTNVVRYNGQSTEELAERIFG